MLLGSTAQSYGHWKEKTWEPYNFRQLCGPVTGAQSTKYSERRTERMEIILSASGQDLVYHVRTL